ncbi:unknown [Clostridium sp. CAG:710]|nr:unknown [Clostridium sp. CAG:710]
MQMTKFEYLMELIANNVETYNRNSRYKDKFSLTFANGDNIKIYVPNSSVPHLLGVNTNYLMSSGLYREKSSYELLNKMCEDRYRLYRYINDNIIDEKQLFSEHIEKKNSAFVQNLKINIFNMIFACPYDSSRSYTTGKETYKFDYILVNKPAYEEKGIFMLGLAANIDKVNKSKIYVPMSNQYFESIEEAEERFGLIFNNQKLTIPTMLTSTSTNNTSKFFLHGDQKLAKARETQQIADKCFATLDVSEDYRWLLKKYYDSMNSGGYVQKDYATIITDCITTGKIITPQMFDLQSFAGVNEFLLGIINAHNDFISHDSTVAINDPSVPTYTDLKKEVEELTTTRDALISANKELVSTNDILAKENEDLKKEVSNNEATINDAIKVLTKTK